MTKKLRHVDHIYSCNSSRITQNKQYSSIKIVVGAQRMILLNDWF